MSKRRESIDSVADAADALISACAAVTQQAIQVPHQRLHGVGRALRQAIIHADPLPADMIELLGKIK